MSSIFWEPKRHLTLEEKRRSRVRRIAIFCLIGLLAFLTVAAVRHAPPHQVTAGARDFKLGTDGISRWPADIIDVKFSVDTTGSGDVDDDGDVDSDDVIAALAAVGAGFDTWQPSRVTYTVAAAGAPNQCGGENRVSWASIDGEGGVLAETKVCRNLVTKEIIGFSVTFDSSEEWSSSGANSRFDLQSIAAHEAGHITGLDHINDPEAKRLTMFFATQTGDIGPRTLGCGDRLGINALYGTSLSCSSVPSD